MFHSIFDLTEERRNIITDWFWAKVEKHDNNCWIWKGATTITGYGIYIITSVPKLINMPAHRVAYELTNGRIPDGLTLDHLCKNPSCVNPLHLEPVTLKINVLRGNSVSAKSKIKTHCNRGHSLTIENCYARDWKKGVRSCKLCARLRSHEHQAQLRKDRPLRHNRNKTHCIHGHPFTPKNLLKTPLKQGRRGCKLCKRLQTRKYRENAKQRGNFKK
jgi:hypothetical protein